MASDFDSRVWFLRSFVILGLLAAGTPVGAAALGNTTLNNTTCLGPFGVDDVTSIRWGAFHYSSIAWEKIFGSIPRSVSFLTGLLYGCCSSEPCAWPLWRAVVALERSLIARR